MQKSVADELFSSIHFDDKGLTPAIAQQYDSGEVLMLAWMNRDSILETFSSGLVTYFSRSRQSLWKKGESSGQIQKFVEMRIDCDGDALLVLVDQKGVACHTGHRSCFYTSVRDDRLVENAPALILEQDLYK